MMSYKKTGIWSGRRHFRAFGAGFLTCISAGLVLVGSSLAYWPKDGVLGLFRLVFEGIAPHILIVGLATVLGLRFWGLRLVSLTLACVAVLALLGLYLTVDSGIDEGGLHAVETENSRDVAVESVVNASLATDYNQGAAVGSLDVIWLNVLWHNLKDPADIAQALTASGADVIVLAEAIPLQEQRAYLRETYPHQLGCEDADCALWVLSRLPFAAQEVVDTSRAETLVRFRVQAEHAVLPEMLAVHLVKPWYSGFIDKDLWFLEDRTRKALQRPKEPAPTLAAGLMVMGDFNTPPWGRLLREYMREFDLSWSSWPLATWPVWADNAGVAIDHMLVGGGAWLSGQRSFGANLGSNHRGLRATLHWPQAVP